jgi:CelD/BcsL family acetyltransferase involved in cellulose biosynthesis
VNISLHTDSSVFETLKPEWNALLHQSTSDTIFCTWEWQSTWWNTYQAGQLWVVTCRTDDGVLVGIGSWFIETKAGERVVRTVGCVDVTDYVDVIAHVDHVDVVQTHLAAFLAENHKAYDRVNLCNIPEASPTLSVFPDRLRAQGMEVDVEFQEVCPVIALPSDWEDYLGALDKKQRHEIRRKLRRAEHEAAIEWYVVGANHDLMAELEQFLMLMRASHPEKARFLDDSRNEAFFRAFVPVTFGCGWLKLSFLVINGKRAASYLDFDYGGQILVYNSGLLSDEYAHLSAGVVLLSYNIRHAIETGHSVFDFLRGNEIYKYRMGGQDTRVFKLKARMPNHTGGS